MREHIRTGLVVKGAVPAALTAVALLGAAALARMPPKDTAAPLRYNRDIRPILSENCFACHGPDSAARKANLRLDRREDAVKGGVLVPGRPEKSRLVARIFAVQEAQLMPPPASHKRLTAAQKSILKRWIAQDAPYEPHWSFSPLPERVPIPAVKNAAWPRNDVDRFILARLETVKIAPSPDAAPLDWLRRVTLDLTGLPPTPAEADAFLADRSKTAYETVVDRLLASPRYGERMALPWLDVARYADSYGYQSDQLSPTWPYRDWVVRAFNSNLSYDKFLTWQMAGDLLPDATREQKLATAFNRLHRMTNEGGSVPEEWRQEYVADRVKTFGTAFLGLTTECAHCHDHKYDPLSQRDYYALASFFNNIDEHGLYDRADIVPSPSLLLPTPEQEKALSDARSSVENTLREIRQRYMSGDGLTQFVVEAKEAPIPDMIGKFDFEKFEGTKLTNLVEGATKHGARSDEVPLVEGKFGKAAQLDGENNVHFPELGRFGRHNPFTIAFWMRDAREAAEPCVVFQACSGTDAGPHGYDLILEKGRLTARLFRHWPGNAIAVQTRAEVPKDTWTHVAVTYDGSSLAQGLRVYLNGKEAASDIIRNKMVKGIGQHTLVFGQRFRDKGFKGGRIDEVHIYARDLTPLEVATDYDGQALKNALTQPTKHMTDLGDYYFSALDPEMRKLNEKLASARQRVVTAEDAQPEIAVMEEMPEPRPTYVLARGQYDAPRTEANRVHRESPSAFAPFPPGAPRNRLGLAEWLVQPNHPLTARAAVNRFWAQLFGRGLVETVEDFGTQGKLPSHPELLDWLARDFVRSGWDTKALIKKLVLSRTYRQASALRPDLVRRDPQNVQLARGPSRRLGAEAIRDLALSASGLLDSQIGGPPVSPYQPGDLWRESNTMSSAYKQSVGADLYRRSLYSVLKRTVPMPNMTTFDAVSREVCTARRTPTNTPLQALVLLNDIQFVEAARVLAERAVKEAEPRNVPRLEFIFRQLATRPPTVAELNLLLDLYYRQHTAFQNAPEQAAKLLRLGERKPDAALPAAEVAALTVVAQTILNLDAVIWER